MLLVEKKWKAKVFIPDFKLMLEYLIVDVKHKGFNKNIEKLVIWRAKVFFFNNLGRNSFNYI